MRARAALIVMALGGAAAADGKIAVKSPLPPGPYTVVEYSCFHSNAPFGPGSQYRERVFDLAARVESRRHTETKDKAPLPPPAPPTKVKLAADVVAKLTAAVDAVLKGGPYAPEYPVPEGTSCHLTIYAAKRDAVAFEIDKAYTKETDAVSALVTAMPAWNP